MPTSALDILVQALVEIDKTDYSKRTDKLLSVFDDARMSISPPQGRTPERHLELTQACQTAQRELTMTIANKYLDEPESYAMLTMLKHIPKAGHKRLLELTIQRLRHQTAAA